MLLPFLPPSFTKARLCTIARDQLTTPRGANLNSNTTPPRYKVWLCTLCTGEFKNYQRKPCVYVFALFRFTCFALLLLARKKARRYCDSMKNISRLFFISFLFFLPSLALASNVVAGTLTRDTVWHRSETDYFR